MIDYEQIGKRINEERKYLRKISQEKMAEDLGMYQADISNLEKAKNGSGITDLSKLDMIADYFDIPLEKLLFGQEEKNMIKYHGTKMQLENKGVVKKISKAHKEKLAALMGENPEEINVYCFVCGPYSVYIATEYQMEMDTIDGELKPVSSLPKHHFYCFMNDEIVGTMTAAAANVMSMINQELLVGLCNMIQRDVLDPTDVCRTINPYWALMQFEEDESEQEKVMSKMFDRMEDLKKEADKVILFIESAYVREGYRRNGMLRLMLDVANTIAENPIMWLNLEPTAGFELDEEYTYLPQYVQAAEGQLSENAAVAEKLGFTIDPDVWHKRIYIEDENGDVRDEVVEMRKCAYKLPESIKEIIKDDGNLVEIGRAKQTALHMKQEVEAYNDGIIDIYL